MEAFFRILKTSTRIEDRRLDAAADLRKCLALDAITAWRVFDRQRAARDTPEQSATDWLSDDAIQTARVLLDPHGIHTGQWSPDEPLTLATCGVDLARLVGFHPSRRQPMSGAAKLWQAMGLLMTSTIMYQAMKPRLRDPPP